MDTSANTITTMGIISDEAYQPKYFIDEYNLDGSKKVKTISGTTYKAIDHTEPNGTKAADTIQALSYYDTNKVVNNPSHQKAA